MYLNNDFPIELFLTIAIAVDPTPPPTHAPWTNESLVSWTNESLAPWTT